MDGEEGGTTSQAFVGCRSPGGDRALAIPFSRQRWIVSSPNGMIVWYSCEYLLKAPPDAKLNDVMLDGFGAMPPQQLSNDDALEVTAYLRLTFAG